MRKVSADQFALTRAFHPIRHADDREVDRLNRFVRRIVEILKTEIAELEARAGVPPDC